MTAPVPPVVYCPACGQALPNPTPTGWALVVYDKAGNEVSRSAPTSREDAGAQMEALAESRNPPFSMQVKDLAMEKAQASIIPRP